MGISGKHDYRKTVLDNGFQIHSINIPDSTDKVYMELNVATGAGHENGRTGIAHYLEHMFSYGSDAYGEKALLPYFDSKGMNCNFATSQFRTYYFVYARPEKCLEYLERTGNVLCSPAFTSTHVGLERMPIHTEALQDYDEIRHDNNYLAYRELYKNHRVSVPIIGTLDDIAAISFEDVRAFYEAAYTGPNMYLIATGKVDHDWLVRNAEMIFSGLPAAQSTLVRRPLNFIPGTKIIEKDDQSANIKIGIETPGKGDPDFLIQRHILNSFSRRLNETLRHDRKLVYACRAAMMHQPGETFQAHDLYISPKNVETVLAGVAEVIQDTIKSFGQEHIDRLVAYEEEYLAEFQDHPREVGEILSSALLNGGSYMPIDEDYERLLKLTPEDMQRAACALLERKAFMVGVGPVGTLPDIDAVMADIRTGLAPLYDKFGTNNSLKRDDRPAFTP